jgi:hypothetical protein
MSEFNDPLDGEETDLNPLLSMFNYLCLTPNLSITPITSSNLPQAGMNIASIMHKISFSFKGG